MVEFRFDIKPLFPQPIIMVNSNLLPHTFTGDRRMAMDTSSKMSQIIDRLGELSAASQKLNKAVTTSQKLRMSDNQKLYLLADATSGQNGAVVGLLKVGTKSLYLFDEGGEAMKVDDTPCILDFYIHESRQRAGLGKDLFEWMLSEEKWAPIKLSIDRPSEKLLGFFKKHYGLEKTIPQSNNFVLYEGFFGQPGAEKKNQERTNGLQITDSPNTALFGPHFIGDANKKRTKQQQDTSPQCTPITQISPVGRYAAPRPTCSMAEPTKRESEVSLTPSQISRLEKSNGLKKNPLDAITRPPKIKEFQEKRSGLQNVREDNYQYYTNPFTQKHPGRMQHEQPMYNNNAAGQPSQPLESHVNAAGTPSRPPAEMETKAPPSEPKIEENANAGNIIHSSTKPNTSEASSKISDVDDSVKEEEKEIVSVCEEFQNLQTDPEHEIKEDNEIKSTIVDVCQNLNEIADSEPACVVDGGCKEKAEAGTENITQMKKPTSFQLNKQHTGLKNISFNVGMAVTPTNKMEFDQEQTDEFGVVKINRPPGKLVSPPPPENIDAMSISSGEGFTDQGYYDLKFYHNKLW